MTKLVQGVGVYEPGPFRASIEHKSTKEYNLWVAMLSRCNPNGAVQLVRPTYDGCTIHPDFIHFQDFAAWCQNQVGFDVQGFSLDKDLLVPGNKVYGPDTCCFVPVAVNNLLIYKQTTYSKYPPGVSYKRDSEKFQAALKVDGKSKYLGVFDTPQQASIAYQVAKLKEVRRKAEQFKDVVDVKVYTALLELELNT